MCNSAILPSLRCRFLRVRGMSRWEHLWKTVHLLSAYVLKIFHPINDPQSAPRPQRVDVRLVLAENGFVVNFPK